MAGKEADLYKFLGQLGSGGVTAAFIVVVIGCFFMIPFGPAVSSSPVPWLFAIASTVVGSSLLFAFCRPVPLNKIDDMIRPGAGDFFFTATIGIILILLFQVAANYALTVEHAPGKAAILLGLLKLVGIGYAHAFSGDGDPISGFFAMLISVGICEEIVKILPVVYYVGVTPLDKLSFRKVLFVGAMSGLGFGVSEGIYYCFMADGYLSTGMPFGMYVMRFGSVAWLHAVWTILSSAVLYWNRNIVKNDKPASSGEKAAWFALLFLVGVCFASAAIHSFYNTIPPLGIFVCAGLLFGLSRWPDPDAPTVSASTANLRGRKNNSVLAWTGGLGCAGVLGVCALICCAGIAGSSDAGISARIQGQWQLVEDHGSRLPQHIVIVSQFNENGTASLSRLDWGRKIAAGTGRWEVRDGDLYSRSTITFSIDPSIPAGFTSDDHDEIVSLADHEMILRDRVTGEQEVWISWTAPGCANCRVAKLFAGGALLLLT